MLQIVVGMSSHSSMTSFCTGDLFFKFLILSFVHHAVKSAEANFTECWRHAVFLSHADVVQCFITCTSCKELLFHHWRPCRSTQGTVCFWAREVAVQHNTFFITKYCSSTSTYLKYLKYYFKYFSEISVFRRPDYFRRRKWHCTLRLKVSLRDARDQ